MGFWWKCVFFSHIVHLGAKQIFNLKGLVHECSAWWREICRGNVKTMMPITHKWNCHVQWHLNKKAAVIHIQTWISLTNYWLTSEAFFLILLLSVLIFRPFENPSSWNWERKGQRQDSNLPNWSNWSCSSVHLATCPVPAQPVVGRSSLQPHPAGPAGLKQSLLTPSPHAVPWS